MIRYVLLRNEVDMGHAMVCGTDSFALLRVEAKDHPDGIVVSIPCGQRHRPCKMVILHGQYFLSLDEALEVYLLCAKRELAKAKTKIRKVKRKLRKLKSSAPKPEVLI